MEFNDHGQIEVSKRGVLEAALNIARLRRLGFYLDEDGNRVHGDREHQGDLLQHALKRHADNWLDLLACQADTSVPSEAQQ